MNRLLISAVAVVLTCPGCDRPSPLATGRLVKISGYVYFQAPSGGEPMIADALITVRQDNGDQMSASTDTDGFYALFVRSGSLSIGASKDGFEDRIWQLDVTADTVLNFALVPRVTLQ